MAHDPDLTRTGTSGMRVTPDDAPGKAPSQRPAPIMDRARAAGAPFHAGQFPDLRC
jgi:hypothetical protein